MGRKLRIFVFAVALSSLASVPVLREPLGISKLQYSLAIAPFIEEATKVLLLGPILSLWGRWIDVKARSVLFIPAFLLGLIFGVAETVLEYPITIGRIIPIANHGFWMLILGGSIYRSCEKKAEWVKLISLYLATCILAHMSWNFGVALEIPEFLWVCGWITGSALFLSLWRLWRIFS